jgi:hypothetical protein
MSNRHSKKQQNNKITATTTETAVRSKTTAVLPSIELTAAEEALFDKFRNWCRRENLNITLRVAGGWVRDRLLGKSHSVDLDLVMDKMNPKKFLKLINRWNSFDRKSYIRFIVVERNPEKLKFVEPGDDDFIFGRLLFCLD